MILILCWDQIVLRSSWAKIGLCGTHLLTYCATQCIFKTWIAINQMRVKVIFAKWYQANGLMILLYLTDLERGHHILFLQFYPLYYIYFLEWLFLGFLGMVISSILPTLKNTFLITFRNSFSKQKNQPIGEKFSNILKFETIVKHHKFVLCTKN